MGREQRNTGATYAKRLAPLFIGALAILLLAGSASAQTAPPKATAAATAHCQYASPGGPCAPIMSSYTYWGYREGDLTLIWAKLGPNKTVGHIYKTFPTPGAYPTNERSFTWHTAPGVEIVGAYILHFDGSHGIYTKVPSGKHSGQTTMTETQGTSSPPILVLQGRHVRATPSRFVTSLRPATPKATAAKKECPLAPSNVPCHGTTIESVYTFSGYHEGDLKLIWVTLGPDQRSSLSESQESRCPECREADKRTFAWHSVASVEITAVYVLRQAGRIEKYQKLPTGKHSGHITLIDLIGGSSPTLLLQGRRVGR